jgi:extradiol dioxygenase family protein
MRARPSLEDRITLDFFSDQLVWNRSDKIDPDPELYPRHFGVTFARREDFDPLVALVERRHLPVFLGMARRFERLVEEHLTLVLRPLEQPHRVQSTTSIRGTMN